MKLIDADRLCTDLLERWNTADTKKEELIRAVMADIVTPIVVSQPTIDPQPHWISCSERLPEEKGEYLVAYHPCYWDDVKAEVKVGIDSFRGKTSWAKRKHQRVIAWMPLPEPYRKDGEADG